MPETLDIIRAEHRRLAMVLKCFIGVLQDIKDKQQSADFDLFEQVVVYLETFLQQFHHLKEDQYLFPRLLLRNPSSAIVISRLETEHIEGREILIKLRNNLDAYRKNPQREVFMAFYNIAMVYRDFEWHHMGTEEREVFPDALKSLSTADWQELDAIFTQHDDPLFGQAVKDEFRNLASRIVNKAPAPHGLGSE